MSDIPGFYYDPIKKRYFAVQPGHNNFNPLTQKSVETEMATRRIHEEAEKHKSNKRRGRVDSSMMDVPVAIGRRQSGSVTPGETMDSMRRSRVAGLRLLKSLSVRVLDYRGEERLDAVCTHMIGNPREGHLYALMDTQDDQTLLQIRLNRDILREPYGSELKLSSQFLVEKFMPACKIQDYYFQPSEDGSTTVAVLNNQSAMNQTGSISIHSSLQIRSVHPRPSSYDLAAMTYEFPYSFLCCSVHSNTKFVIGGDRLIGLFQIDHYGRSFRSPVDYCAHSIRFSTDGKRLLTGSHRGEIFLYSNLTSGTLEKPELRILTAKRQVISRIHVLKKEEHQFLASTFDNGLYLYDWRRPTHPVMEFVGHVNRDKKLPINVDEEMGIVLMGGSDSVVRFWSLASGKILAERPPERDPNFSSSHETFPLYSSSWNLFNGPKPMFCSMNANKIHFYSDDLEF